MTAVHGAARPTARGAWSGLGVAGGTVAAGIAATVAAMYVDDHINTLREAACHGRYAGSHFDEFAPGMPWYGYALAFAGVVAVVAGLVLAIRARRAAITARKAAPITVAVLLGLVASIGVLFGLVIANGVVGDATPDYVSTCPSG